MNSSRTKKTIYLSLIMFLFSMSQVIVNIFLARSLTKTDFGIYRTIFLYFTIFSTFFTYSISPSVLYFFSKHPDRKKEYLSNSVFMLVMSSLFVGICFFVMSIITGYRPDNANMSLFFKVYALYSVFSISSAYYIQLLIAESNYPKLFQYTSIIIVLRVLNVVFVVVQTKNLFLILYAMCLIEFVHFVYVLINSKKELARAMIQKPVLKEILWYSMPIAFATLLNTLSSEGGKLVITWMSSKEAFAIYALGATEIPLFRTITFSAGNVILPDITKLYLNQNYDEILKIWKSSVLKLSLIMVPLTFFFYFHADALITILFSEKYTESIKIFQLCVLVVPLEIFLYTFFFRATGRVKYIYYGSLMLTLGTFVLTYFCVKYFGIIGAAISRVVLMYAYVAVQILWMAGTLRKKFLDMINLKDMAFVILLSLCSAYVSLFPKFFHKTLFDFCFQGVVFLCFYGLVISFTKYKSMLPLEKLRKLFLRSAA